MSNTSIQLSQLLTNQMSQIQQHHNDPNSHTQKQEEVKQAKVKNEEPNSDTQTNTTEEIQEEKVSKPEPSKYYKNRAYLFNWCRNQCAKFTFFKETFANVITLLDRFFKVNILQQETFIAIALSIMIISSKALERKVLYTSTVARNNKLSFVELLNTEMKLLEFFKFRISSYNFVRAMNEYLKRWNERIASSKQQAKEGLLFYKDSFESYILYEEMYSLCEQFDKQRKFLRESSIKAIFKFVICYRHNSAQSENIIDQIFSERVFSVEEENDNIFQAIEKDPEEQRKDLIKMRQHFIDSIFPLRKQNYEKHKNGEKYQCYEQFMAHLA